MHAQAETVARLDSARAAALLAQPLILKHFARGAITFQTKADGSPVTAADVGAEEIICAVIRREWPDDGIVGEECGTRAGRSEHRWVIDPIDGTKSFVRGVPLFGTLIGIQRRTAPGEEGIDGWRSIAGVARFPALEECIWGWLGGGAWGTSRGSDSARPIRVSSVRSLAESTISTTTPQAMLEAGERSATAPRGAREAYIALNRAAQLSRGWSDCYGTLLVATGRIEAMIDPPMKLWDVAALEPIVIEAGGRLSGWDGRATDGSTGAIASNGLIHDEVVAIMRR